MKGDGKELAVLKPHTGLEINHIGPSLELGPLPSFFYFALSGRDSLLLDPYNQPIAFLDKTTIRCFSFSLPYHEDESKYKQGMEDWAKEFKNNPYFLEKFFDLCLENIEYLIHQKLVDAKHIAVGGLSRGGFIAAHLAARNSNIQTVLGFAPLISLNNLVEFNEYAADPIVQALDVANHIDKLIHKRLRYYIGNRDERAGTNKCYEFISKLANTAFEKGVRSPQAELILFPSIGHKGHGTPPDIFQAGANWLFNELTTG